MLIYVSTIADSVVVYDAAADGDALPLRNIKGPSTGLNGPSGVALDSAGNVCVGNAANSTVTVYGPTADGDAAPVRTINGNATGLGVPGGVAIDSFDNLYVLNTGGIPSNRTITVYSPGADGNAAPIRTLTGIQVADGNLDGIAIDQFDNLYLSESIPGLISVYAPGANGSVAPIRTISGGNVPSDMGFDAGNHLYVSDGSDVLVFDPAASGSPAPIRQIIGPSTGLSDDFSLAVDSAGLVYVGNIASDFSSGSVTVYAVGADGNAAPIRTIAGPNTGLGLPSGIAIDKAPPTQTQDNWRWCNKCQGLFFAGNPTTGTCPAEGEHDHTNSGNYILTLAPAQGQDNWRWCNKCQGLFFAGNPTTGACPAEGGHDYGNSGDYVLSAAPGKGQDNWRWCNKCQGLFFAGNPTTGACPAEGGHDYGSSGNYVLPIT